MCKRTMFIDGKSVTVDGVAKCSSCGIIAPAETHFYADRHRSTGVSSRCRACDRKRLESIPERSLVTDLKALMKRHPQYRPVLESMANAVAA